MVLSLGEPGNRFESDARMQLREQIGDEYHVIHPADFDIDLRKLVFTDLDFDEYRIWFLNSKIIHATSEEFHGSDPLSNTDRSTEFGCDVLLLPRVTVTLDNLSEIRSQLMIGEIKLKNGNCDAGTLGSTAHLAWKLEREGVRRQFALITNYGSTIAPAIRDLYRVFSVEVTDSVKELGERIKNASLDKEVLCRLVEAMTEHFSGDVVGSALAKNAEAAISFVAAYRKRYGEASEACERSKAYRLGYSARALDREREAAAKKRLKRAE